MRTAQHLAYTAIIRSRPLRRRLTARSFKEYYSNHVLGKRPGRTTYLEIGVFDGESVHAARADRKLGVDPDRRVPLHRLHPGGACVIGWCHG